MSDKVTDKRPQFFMIEDAVVTDFNLDPYTGWLYVAIVKHADRKTGEAFPGIARLAKLCNMSRSQVMRGIKLLEEKRLIEVKRDTKPVKGEKRQREVNHYQVLSASGSTYQQLGVVSGSDYPSVSEQLGVVSGVERNKNHSKPESNNEVALPISKWNSGHYQAYFDRNEIVLGAICNAAGLDLKFRAWNNMGNKERAPYVETCEAILAAGVDITAYISYLKKEFSWRKPFKLSLGDFNNNVTKFEVAQYRATQPKIITGVWAETDVPEIKDVGLTKQQRLDLIASTSTKKVVSA